MRLKNIIIYFFVIYAICFNSTATADHPSKWVQGIYISESTMRNTPKIQRLIDQAKDAGVDTFVVDYEKGGRLYEKNIKLVNQSGLKYVARIVVFPDGGTNTQILSPAYWEKQYKLVEKAIQLGAKEIQLDYIRYDTSQPPSAKNAQNIHNVIKWFKNKLDARGIPLQIDVFGVAAFSESYYIGQSLPLFADSVDAVCPMLYPSHFEPYQKYAKMPYFIIHSSLKKLQAQFYCDVPFKVYPYIEVYNYRHPLSQEEKIDYIRKEILAVEDAKSDGFYVWNIHNDYSNLFYVLKNS